MQTEPANRTDYLKSTEKPKTLRSLKGAVIVVECARCELHGEMERKALVKRFQASATITRVRRGVVGYCERMCADGIDRCDAKITATK